MVSIGTISYLGSHGAELLRAGLDRARARPGLEDWARRIHEFGREADTPDLRRRRVRLEDKGAIVAFHWRGAPDEEAARGGDRRSRGPRARRPACAPTGGARCSRSGRRCGSTRAPGIVTFLDEPRRRRGAVRRR